jgi:Flp pilus assembly protein TadB
MIASRKTVTGRQHRRSAFRQEFYKGQASQPDEPPDPQSAHRPHRIPIWALAVILTIVLCLIAVGGSTAMIWLKNLAALVDVHWAGD